VDLADASGSAPFSSTDLGRRFGVSRTHVRELLRDAQDASLVTLADGVVKLSAELLSAFDRFMANGMSGHDLIFRQAMSMLAEA
jgi:DNA-binding FadR family transcriptional regulator